MSPIDLVRQVREAIAECRRIDAEYHCFTHICEEEALAQAAQVQERLKGGTAGRLAGLLVTVKDNLCMKDVESAAGSAILKGYLPAFDATAIERLKAQDAIILGRTAMDEFGFGSWNTNAGIGFPVPRNPHDRTRVAGGSSGGSAVITALATFRHVSLAESTGGSIENPAALCGVVGFCPTYGRVSRHGLIPYANSLDKIGLMSKSAADLPLVLETIAGHDPNDATSIRTPLRLEGKETFRIGIIREGLGEGVAGEIRDCVQRLAGKLRERGHVVEDVSLPTTFKYGLPAYYVIATSEASTNLACLCGLRYGQQGDPQGRSGREYFTRMRSEHFGQEAKRRIILGTFARMHGYRDAYYLQATRVRTLIIGEYKRLLDKYDVLISPTMPFVAPSFDDVGRMTPLQSYLADILTVGPNLAGVPHASVPLGAVDGLPVGLMAIADHVQEGTLLSFLRLVEELR